MPQDPWLPVETDVPHVRYLDASLFQTILHCLVGEAAVVFPARKAFFLSSRDDFTVVSGLAHAGMSPGFAHQASASFLTGVPFSSGYARVLAVNPETKAMEPFIYNLTSAVDVFWRERPGQRPQFFALEFSVAQLATPAGPGRLLRYDSPAPQVVLSDLRAPVSLTFDAATEELFILELSGRILKVSAK